MRNQLCPRCGGVKDENDGILCEKCKTYFPPPAPSPPKKLKGRLCLNCGKRLEKGNRNRYCYRCMRKLREGQAMTDREYDIEASAQAQTTYCDRNNLPCFAPRDGYCPHCEKNIYTLYIYHGKVDYRVGISTEEAGKRLITSCPHCHYSFTD